MKCKIRGRATSDPNLDHKRLEKEVYHHARYATRVGGTHGFLGDLANIFCDPYASRVLLEELLASGGVDIVDEERVLSWDFCSEVLSHRVA